MSRKKRRRPSRPGSRSDAWDALYPALDLHGETAESARRRAERWLRAQQVEGERTVRVITGRGLHSIGPPVLRGEIEDLLSTLRGTLISRYSSESGGGAYRVELARPSKARRTAPSFSTRSPPSGYASPELRRLAEEALSELGITPTPTLIDAEVRRLLREEQK
jgi:hypothetical protein